MAKAIFVGVGEQPKVIDILEGQTFRDILGGYGVGITVDSKTIIVVDEDGHQKNLLMNHLGDKLIRDLLRDVGRTLHPGDYIVGPVLVCGVGLGGDTVDLSEKKVKFCLSCTLEETD